MTEVELVGRSLERAALGRVLDALGEGLSSSLVLRGDAGVGKTVLLRQFAQDAPGVEFAWLSGVESETSLGFAGLHRLLIPLLPSMKDLPAIQRSALGSALGLHQGPATTVFLIGQAVLTMLANAAHGRPLVCVIDDAQWVDQESLEVLAFVARRVYAEQLGIVFGVREPPRNQLLEGIPDLTITGLSPGEAVELLIAITAGKIDSQVAQRLAPLVDGNPLALTEVGRHLDEGRLAPDALLNGPLPLGRRLEEHFQAQVHSLPPPTRAVLLLAAANTSADPNILWRAAALNGLSPEAAIPAEVGLLVDRGPELGFRHPLIRAAVYATAHPADRREAHQALARVTDPETGRDQRAWHLAAAAQLPDENIAAELESCAEIARRRGGFLAVASFMGRAGALSPDPSRAVNRFLTAANAALRAGAPHRAKELLDLAAPHLRDPFARARAQLISVDIGVPLGEPQTHTVGIRIAAARVLAPLDSALARRTLLEVISSLIAGRPVSGSTPAELARATLELWPAPPRGPGVEDHLLQGLATILADGYVQAAPYLRRAVAMIKSGSAGVDVTRLFAASTDLGTRIQLAAYAAAIIWDDRVLLDLLRHAVETHRELGALDSLSHTLLMLSMSEAATGQLAAAHTHAEEARRFAGATGYAVGRLASTLTNAKLLAWQGEDEAAQRVTDDMSAMAEYLGVEDLNRSAWQAQMIMHLGRGRYREAYTIASRTHVGDSSRHDTEALPTLIEAGMRIGERKAAATALQQLQVMATASGTPWALGLLARSAALLATDSAAEPLYQESVHHLEKTIVLTDRARTHLLYGEWLRRQKRRADARIQLRLAYHMFLDMGAPAFAERARVELAATGEKVRKRSVETPSQLTPQEAQVIQCAAAGLTNQDIATQLFISAHTVSYHLTKAFRKLRITSRRELILSTNQTTQPPRHVPPQ